MTAGQPPSGRAWSRARLLALAPLMVSLLAACLSAGPPKSLYILGDLPSTTAPAQIRDTDLPVLQVHRVLLPDYLDSTDILVRRGNELVPRRTSRWAERLSVGMQRALTAALAARLPRMAVLSGDPYKPPRWHLFAEVGSFEAQPDGRVTLTAHWSLRDAAGDNRVSAQASIYETLAGTRDGALVAAMTRAVDALAEQLAAAIRSLPH